MTNHVHAWAIIEDTSREPAFLLCLCGEIRAVAKDPLGVCPIERYEDGLPTSSAIDWPALIVIGGAVLVCALAWVILALNI